MAAGFFHIPQVAEVYRQREVRQQAANAAMTAPIRRSEDNVTESLSDDEFYARLISPVQPPALTDDEQELMNGLFNDGEPDQLTDDERSLYESLYPSSTTVSSDDDDK